MKSIRAGGIVINEENKIALANERIWGFPRGGVEEGESFITAAKREVLEEVGLKDFLSIEELGVYERYPGGITEDTPGAYPMEIHMFVFRVKGLPKLKPTDSKVKETGWFTYEKALERISHEKDILFLESVWKQIEAKR
jgi:8-oxo-dGTP pyrophosphatase MutT (NUDIX family)